MQNWYHTHLRRLFFDMHLPDWTQPGQSGGDQHDLRDIATRFDPKAIVAEFVRARVNVAVIFAKCQYGNFYYNTALGHKHTGLGALDFMGEVLEEAHRQGIRVLGYYSNMWDTQIAREHPEWMAEEADGTKSYNRWPTLSLNSPYRQRVHEHLHEMFTQYPLDGVWSDILSDFPSWDIYTRQLYEAAFGRPMPRAPKDDGWIEMIRWQQDLLYDYIESCRAVVKAANPEAAYVVNFFGTPYAKASQGLSFKHLALSDMGSTEGYSEWHGLLFPSYAARYIRAGMLGKPFEVLTSRFVHTWDFSVRSLAQMRYEAFSVVANGGAVCIDDEPYHDGRIEPQVYDRIGDAFREIERREPLLIGAEPVRYAALYQSQKGRELDEVMNQSRPPAGSLTPPSNLNPSASDMLASWMGAFKALTEAHIPVQIVDERPESLATLAQYKVVYLPNILTLSDEEAEALRAYVHAGGGLVATGATSLYDAFGHLQADFALADLFGVHHVGRGDYTFPFFQFHGGPLSGGLPGHPLPHYMAMWRVRLGTGDLSIAATRRDPLIETRGETYYHNNQPPPGDDSDEPVIVYRRYGKGRVVYCAGLPESNYARLSLAPYRRLIANMIEWAAGEAPLVQADGLLNTEIVCNRLGDDLIVHLVTGVPVRAVRFGLNRTVDAIEERAQIANAQLIIPDKTEAVLRMPDAHPLPIVRVDGHAAITLPILDDWESLKLTGVFRRLAEEAP
ncbi:MAG: beta-galactosidase trimerization domain-containing protein [Anaerolineae bacterium]|nr:beta-galactosidase trimerization domain-containing protein [Anaerolineae bacterium]